MPALDPRLARVIGGTQGLQVVEHERERGMRADGLDVIDLEAATGAALDAAPPVAAKRLEAQRGPSARARDRVAVARVIVAAARHDHTGTRALRTGFATRRAPSATAITADVLTDWMRAHPDELDDFLAINRSYIFFEEAPVEGDGPVAAAKVPLTAGRSLAVDRTLHSFGLPFWIESDGLPEGAGPASRLTIAQDTGSAIVGAARGDLFVGSGAEAGRVAGRINHPTRFFALVPKVRR